jgi:hypothetical protein
MTDPKSKPTGKPPLGYIASKVIARARYSSAAKAAAIGLLDHVNWKTSRCDPSINRLVELLPFARSNIQSGLKAVEADGILIIHRHGGRSGRSSYEFNWDEIQRRDAEFQKALHSGRGTTRNQGAECSDIGAQTLSKNPNIEPGLLRAAAEPLSEPKASNGSARRDIVGRSPLIPRLPSSQQAAEAAALRRWNDDLLACLKDEPIVFEIIVELIDVDIQNAATEAELRRRGDGLRLILDYVRQIRPELLDGRYRGRDHG